MFVLLNFAKVKIKTQTEKILESCPKTTTQTIASKFIHCTHSVKLYLYIHLRAKTRELQEKS